MKAVDYLNKYEKQLESVFFPLAGNDKIANVGKDIILDMGEEVKVIAEQRKARSNGPVLSIILEINSKWNAFVKLVEKRYGLYVFKRDAFKKLMYDPLVEKK